MDFLQSMLYIYTRISSWFQRKLRRDNQNAIGHNIQDTTSSDGHTSQYEKSRRRDLENGQWGLNRIVLGLGRPRTDDDDLITENRQLKARLAQLEPLPAQLDDLRKTLEHESLALQESREQHERAAEDAQQLRTRFMHLDSEAKRSTARITDLQRAVTHAQAERRAALAHLDTRTAELRAAQTFLAAGEDVSDADAIHMVELLNAQVVRTAAAIVAASQLRFEARSKDASATDKAYRRIEHYGWLGPSLLGALRSCDHSRDPTLAQIAIQAGMIMYARWLALSWDFGALDPRALLENVYLRIREREPQSVSGRWRALCRTHIKGLVDTGETQTKRLFKTLSGVVADILVICGATGTLDSVSEALASDFETQFHEILNLALQFQWVAGECIITRDLSVYAEEPEAPFDATSMIDENAVESRRAPTSPLRFGSVLCTTQLGLVSEMQVAGGKEQSGVVRSTALLKPKVLLKSALAGFQSS